jgi:Dolichyl-phosphate-mannose-protein mannosyltransferase
MTSHEPQPTGSASPRAPAGRAWWPASMAVMLVALAVTLPGTGDLGLTWDEPAYRYSQVMSAQWWERLGRARSWSDLEDLFSPDSLVYYWPYGRNGPNLHPPLAGQLCLLTHAAFGRFVKDIPSRRLASVIEYSLTIAILFGFLARRYGPWVGGAAAGALLFTPRVFGDGHIAGTDMPGLLLWGATAVAFWEALHAMHGGRWRILVGLLIGLAIVEKMAALAVVLPLLVWTAARLPRPFGRRGDPAAWADGVGTLAALMAPLVLAGLEIVRLARLLPPPGQTDLFLARPRTAWPGGILAVPLLIWIVRRILARAARGHRIWGVERPALETWAAVLALAPLLAWLGNPLWWRETLPRLAHYAMLNAARRGALPDIPIFYLGHTYLYTLPWHNAWVLMAITVPAGILVAAMVGLAYGLRVAGRDGLPAYFALHLATLPVIRMLGVPAHDGVRLFLPTFFFLAAFAGWGTIWAADALARLSRRGVVPWRSAVALLVLGPAAWQLLRIHPYELSYYNELIGGPRGAWRAGFELTYWYDAFNPRTIAELNGRLQRGATIDLLNPRTETETFQELQSLGELRGDLRLGIRAPDMFPYAWLLTQDSKATALTRLLFAMRPWYESRPAQLGGLRVATVADPIAVSRAWALQLLLDAPSGGVAERPRAPEWVRSHAPRLAWFWGDDVPRVGSPNVHRRALDWARRDPEGLRSAARAVAEQRTASDAGASRLLAILRRHDPFDPPGGLASDRLLLARPQAIVEAVEILITRGEDVLTVLTRQAYTDVEMIGGFLDRGLP